MGTALIYLLVVLGVAAAFYFGACAIFGRGEELAPPPEGTSPTWLPDPGQDVTAADVRALRFQQALRGYKMAEVDWALDRLAAELDRQHAELAQTRAELAQAYAALDQTRAELARARPEFETGFEAGFEEKTTAEGTG